MIRAVLDANVFVSAVLSARGFPSRILAAWRAEQFHLVISPAILEEISRVFQYPKIALRHRWPFGLYRTSLACRQMCDILPSRRSAPQRTLHPEASRGRPSSPRRRQFSPTTAPYREAALRQPTRCHTLEAGPAPEVQHGFAGADRSQGKGISNADESLTDCQRNGRHEGWRIAKPQGARLARRVPKQSRGRVRNFAVLLCDAPADGATLLRVHRTSLFR